MALRSVVLVLAALAPMAMSACKSVGNGDADGAAVLAASQYDPNWLGTFEQELGQASNFRHLNELRVYVNDEDDKRYIAAKFKPLNAPYEEADITYQVTTTRNGAGGITKRFAKKHYPTEAIDGIPDTLEVAMTPDADPNGGAWTVELKNKNAPTKVDAFKGRYSYTNAGPAGSGG